MKKRIGKLILLLGIVCLCLFGWFMLKPAEEAQAASISKITIYNADALVYYCASVNPWEITLAKDLTVTKPIYVKGKKIIHGNGYTIYGTNTGANDAENLMTVESEAYLEMDNVTLRGTDNIVCGVTYFHVRYGGKAVIKNVVVGNKNETYAKERGCAVAHGLIEAENCSFYASREYGLRIHGAGNHKVTNCTFANNVSGLGCNIESQVDSSPMYIEVNGITAYGNKNNGVTVGLSDSGSYGETYVTVNNGNFYNNNTGVGIWQQTRCNVTINGGTFTSNKASGIYCFPDDAVLTIKGTSTNKVKISDSTLGEGVYIGGGNVSLEYVEITDCMYGVNITTNDNHLVPVEADPGTISIKNSLIEDCYLGVYCSEYDAVTIDNSVIKDATYGITFVGYANGLISAPAVVTKSVTLSGFSQAAVMLDRAENVSVGATIYDSKNGVALYTLSTGKLTGDCKVYDCTIGGLVAGGTTIIEEDDPNFGSIAVIRPGKDCYLITEEGFEVYNCTDRGMGLQFGIVSGAGKIHDNVVGLTFYRETSSLTGDYEIYNNGVGMKEPGHNPLTLFTVDGNVSVYNNTTGVFLKTGSINFNNVTIRDNYDGILHLNEVEKPTITLNNTKIYGNENIGITLDKDCTLNAAYTVKIYNNRVGVASAGIINSKAVVYNNEECGFQIFGGTADINGGSIYNNSTGVEVLTGAIVNINGGKIYKNANYGVSNNNSTVNIANGEFTNNRLGLLLLNGSVTTVNGGKIHTNSEQGIGMKDSTLTVNGGEIYSNTKNGIYIATESDVTITGGKIYLNSNHGIQDSGGGNLNISGGEIYSNTKNALYLASGTVLNMSGGKLYGNSIYGMFVASGAKANISGGEITGNTNYAIKYADGSSGAITGGNIHNNGGAKGEIWHETDSLVVTGVYNGKSSVNGYIYLAKDNNYVTTNDSEVLLSIYPSAYTSGRRCIKTSSNAKALKQKNSTLKANGEWAFIDNADYVVLTMVPGIYYDGVIMDGSMVLPSASGWYNASTISKVGKFSALDGDNDLVSFGLYYNGTLLKKGTVKNGNKGEISYNFKVEGIREYELIAVDSLGNKTSKKVTIRVDLTPPSLLDVSNSEIDWGNSGTEATFGWSVAVISPSVNFTQQGTDALSGVASVYMYKYSDQKNYYKRTFNSPFKVSDKLNNYPTEKGVVIKVVDKAGNEFYKCILNEDNLDIKVQPFYPTK